MKWWAVMLVALSWWAGLSSARDHSIMEIINTKRVKKLIAQQRSNLTRQLLPTPLTTNSLTGYTSPDSGAEISSLFREENQLTKTQKATPNLATVLLEFTGPDKLIETDSGMLVTKKRYVRKDWCKTEPIVQTIREEGCLPKNVINRFCYGQCNSFFIPMNVSGARGRKKRPEEWEETSVFRSCGVCKPKKSAWVQVTLDCPGTSSPLRRRRVHKVKQCHCMAATGY